VHLLVEAEIIPLLCSQLTQDAVTDTRQAALEALQHVMGMGEQIAAEQQQQQQQQQPPFAAPACANPYALLVAECGGLHLLVELQKGGHSATTDMAFELFELQEGDHSATADLALELLRTYFAHEEQQPEAEWFVLRKQRG